MELRNNVCPKIEPWGIPRFIQLRDVLRHIESNKYNQSNQHKFSTSESNRHDKSHQPSSRYVKQYPDILHPYSYQNVDKFIQQ